MLEFSVRSRSNAAVEATPLTTESIIGAAENELGGQLPP